MTPGNHAGKAPGRPGPFTLAGSPPRQWPPAPAPASTRAVELQLAEWHRLYLQLEQARSRLREERANPGGPERVLALQRETERLGAETQRALAALNAALRAARPL